jgi:hypothetical protein
MKRRVALGSQQMFLKHITSPSSGSKSGQREKTAYCLLHAGFFLGSLFDPEDGGDILLRNV